MFSSGNFISDYGKTLAKFIYITKMVLPLRTFGPVKKIFLAIVDSSKSFKRTSPFSLYLNNDAVIDFVPFLNLYKELVYFLQVMISHFL